MGYKTKEQKEQPKLIDVFISKIELVNIIHNYLIGIEIHHKISKHQRVDTNQQQAVNKKG